MAQPAASIHVAIVEDLPAIREGLASLIRGTAGFQIAGTYVSMEEALPGIDRQLPDVVLIDIGLPGISGIEGIRQIKARHPELPLLVLTVHGDDERIFEALCAGACGYLLKKTPPSRLLESIQEVVAGGAPMSPEVARRALALFRDFAPHPSSYQLTPHELRLLRLLAEGHTYTTAAFQLGVTVHTVWFHLRKIYDKLQVHSKSGAVAKALRAGLVR
jgi:DNA-binding NarL/FixJ family response regulator